MTKQIKVYCDYDTLIRLSHSAWNGNNILNYRVAIIRTVPGYTIEFKVSLFPLGELGTFEVTKNADDSCTVAFSAIPFDNYDKWLEQTRQEIDQMAIGFDDKMSLELKRTVQKIDENPGRTEAKLEEWRKFIDLYKEMIARLRHENGTTYLFDPELDALIKKEMVGDELARRTLDRMAREEGYNDYASLKELMIKNEQKRLEATPGVLPVLAHVTTMSKSEHPLHQAIAENIDHRHIYKIAKSYQEKTLNTPLLGVAIDKQAAQGGTGKPEEPPKPPEPKERGGKISLWLDWYHAMDDNGYKCTLEDVASKSGYSLGYIKQKHMVYQAKPNQIT